MVPDVAQNVDVCATFSMRCILDLTPSLTPLIVTVSVYLAWVSIQSARRIARQKATLDLIEKAESDERYRDLNAVFRRYRQDGNLTALNTPASTDDKANRQAVLAYLNHYELVAIGIANQTLDEDFYATWMKGPLVRDWNAAADFIQRERWKWDDENKSWIYYDRIYANFGALAWRWDIGARKLDRRSGGQPDRPVGVGDQAY